nr:MAG: terminase large subunit [Lokiarchaeota virus Ratatoskr Meg22_1012]
MDDPVRFDLFFYGVWDYWYQKGVIQDLHDAIAAVFGRQTGKSDILARRENYNGATNLEDDLISILVAPAQRQSENLYSRCKKYLNRSPILLSELKEGRVLMKGIEFLNGYTIVNMPIGQSADKVRGFSVDELVFEEAAFIPGAAYDALTDSLLSTAGTEIRIGTPNGKANPLYLAFENAFRIHTIPESRWEAWDITKDDMIVKKFDNVDMDDAWSCHHYPSHVGLNVYKVFKAYAKEVWDIGMEDRRFKKRHRGWRVIKTENKRYIGQLITDHWDVISKFPLENELRVQYTQVKDLLDNELHFIVGFPQINAKRLKRQLKRPRNTVERENLALFSDDDGVVFPYEFVVRAFRKNISLWTHPRPNLEYFGGVDIAKGIGGDYSVITIVAYNREANKIQLVYQWKSNKRRIKEVKQRVLDLHKIWKINRWFIDSNTIGTETVEDLQDMLGTNYIDGIGFQTKDKADMVANMEMLLGDNSSPCNVYIPNELEELKHQFKFYTKELSKDGSKLKYHHPDWEGEHDDELDSFMLACLCAKSAKVVDFDVYFIDPIW